jgi:hypothetical protein
MRSLQKLTRLAGIFALASGAIVLHSTAAMAAGGPSTTCQGGSIAPGTYISLDVAGFCALDSGNVVVQKNLTVEPGAGLLAAFGGSNLTVGGNLVVLSNGILVLGCEPEAFTCFNDPDQTVGTLVTNDSVGGNLVADGALMVLAHHNTVGQNVAQSGGGGGVTCATQPLGPDGPPAYSTYEDNTIGANASVTGLQTCWLGFIRNTVSGNVNFNDNVNADPDGNEVVTNTISRNLNCSGDSPAPQMGDSGGNPNLVSGRATGQCVGLT